MEYERIHKVQSGMVSPSKLRMKLLGTHRKKDGSNSNSSRTSPSKLVDYESVNSLLASKSGDFDDQVSGPSLEVPFAEPSNEGVLDASQVLKSGSLPKEPLLRQRSDAGCVNASQTSRIDGGNLSAIHPMRMLEDENLDYDSNASSSSFEFDKGERPVQGVMARSGSRHIPSKWNDAEKWIVNRQNIQLNNVKMTSLHQSTCRSPATNAGRVAPDSCPQVKDLEEVNQRDIKSCTKSPGKDRKGIAAIRSVCMRDMGTEMTPATSLEPSRTATPAEATTPIRSPPSSIPSTPRGGALAPTHDEPRNHIEMSENELSEEEMKLKIRKDIVVLGVQLGKMNIAAWASKVDTETNRSLAEGSGMEKLERVEIEKRAAEWEEAERSKQRARFEHEEFKIRAWESQQKAKLQAEMRKIEAQVEEMRAQARAKMVKRIAMARQRLEEKMAAAEARKARDAERTAAGAERIRETGQIPLTSYVCCGWYS